MTYIIVSKSLQYLCIHLFLWIFTYIYYMYIIYTLYTYNIYVVYICFIYIYIFSHVTTTQVNMWNIDIDHFLCPRKLLPIDSWHPSLRGTCSYFFGWRQIGFACAWTLCKWSTVRSLFGVALYVSVGYHLLEAVTVLGSFMSVIVSVYSYKMCSYKNKICNL